MFSKGCGRAGTRKRTLMDTPSLNPGLWYNWYPPIASRRQAKKSRKAVTGITEIALRTPENEDSFALPSMYGVSCPLDVTPIGDLEF